MSETNWDLFRLFLIVTRVGSLNRAAVELGMSQPTLSRRLSELERYVGAPLFFRSSSGVKMTQEGEDLCAATDRLKIAFDVFQRELNSRLAERSSVLRISATEGLTKHWLLPRVERLQALDSRISLEIFSTFHRQSIAKSDLDFVIRLGDPGDDELVGKRVGAVAFGIFASRQYLSSSPAISSVSDLEKHKIIGRAADFASLRYEGGAHMPLLGHLFAAAESRHTFRIYPVASQYAAAATGLGLAFLAAPFASAEGLVRVLPSEKAFMNVWLLRRRESDLRKLTRKVRRFLETEFAQSKAWLADEQGVRKNRPRP